jgi:hypothetical protein
MLLVRILPLQAVNVIVLATNAVLRVLSFIYRFKHISGLLFKLEFLENIKK